MRSQIVNADHIINLLAFRNADRTEGDLHRELNLGKHLQGDRIHVNEGDDLPSAGSLKNAAVCLPLRLSVEMAMAGIAFSKSRRFMALLCFPLATRRSTEDSIVGPRRISTVYWTEGRDKIGPANSTATNWQVALR